MSVKLMTQVWGLQLDPSRKLVLLALADNANDEGHCWPSITTIAQKCSMDRRTVTRSLQELESLRHITRSGEPGKTNAYSVHPGRNDTSDKLTLGAHSPSPRGIPPRVLGAQCPWTRGVLPPRTIIEPSSEPSKNRHVCADGLSAECESELQAEYPKFTGRSNWIAAIRKAAQLVSDGAATPDELIAGVKRYAAFIAAGGVSGARYVLTPLTFFSADDKPWRQEWIPPPTKAKQQQDANIDAGLQWLRQSGAS